MGCGASVPLDAKARVSDEHAPPMGARPEVVPVASGRAGVPPSSHRSSKASNPSGSSAVGPSPGLPLITDKKASPAPTEKRAEGARARARDASVLHALPRRPARALMRVRCGARTRPPHEQSRPRASCPATSRPTSLASSARQPTLIASRRAHARCAVRGAHPCARCPLGTRHVVSIPTRASSSHLDNLPDCSRVHLMTACDRHHRRAHRSSACTKLLKSSRAAVPTTGSSTGPSSNRRSGCAARSSSIASFRCVRARGGRARGHGGLRGGLGAQSDWRLGDFRAVAFSGRRRVSGGCVSGGGRTAVAQARRSRCSLPRELCAHP
jgi:hypothetical protein